MLPVGTSQGFQSEHDAAGETGDSSDRNDLWSPGFCGCWRWSRGAAHSRDFGAGLAVPSKPPRLAPRRGAALSTNNRSIGTKIGRWDQSPDVVRPEIQPEPPAPDIR